MDAMSDESRWDEASPDRPVSTPKRPGWRGTFKAAAARRALLLTALGGLLIAGLTTALPHDRQGTGLTSYLEPSAVPAAGARSNQTFERAKAGDCLNWPDKTPDSAGIVDCKDDHRFEVAESIDISTFPGSEYGADAAPPSSARIQQITQEQCQVAVQRYLGPKFDPNSRFAVSMLWPGDKAWKQYGERTLLCGLQLPGPDNQQTAFAGKVADADQSKVWPPGTCLGIDPASNEQTDVPVDCASPHAMEVAGVVNLAEKFPVQLPAEPDQDQFIKAACTSMTDAYLAPIELRTTTLTLTYNTVSLPSWTAGSRQVSCLIGATLGNGGWATLLNSAKGPLLINGQPPVPPPNIPPERLSLPPVPMPDSSAGQSPRNSYSSGSSSGSSPRSPSGSSSSGSSSTGSGTGSSSQQDQHLPPGPAPAPVVEQPGPPQDNVINPPAEVPPPALDNPVPPPALGPAPGPADLVPPLA